MTMPDLGLVVIEDSETGEQLFVDTHDRGFRRRFAAAAEQREAELRATFSQAGVDALELATDDDLFDAILRFADLRKRRSQLAAGGGLPPHLGGPMRAKGGPGSAHPGAERAGRPATAARSRR